jgi:hypothetical protein
VPIIRPLCILCKIQETAQKGWSGLGRRLPLYLVTLALNRVIPLNRVTFSPDDALGGPSSRVGTNNDRLELTGQRFRAICRRHGYVP